MAEEVLGDVIVPEAIDLAQLEVVFDVILLAHLGLQEAQSLLGIAVLADDGVELLLPQSLELGQDTLFQVGLLPL